MTDFLKCCRAPDGVKSTILIFVHLCVPGCGSARNVAAALQEQKVDSLPSLQFTEAPPSQCQDWWDHLRVGRQKIECHQDGPVQGQGAVT